MANEISIVLTQQGFFAGHLMKNGTLALGAKKITESEIFSMFYALMRTWKTKTGTDTITIPGTDNSLVVAKLIEVKGQAPAEGSAAAAPPKKKRTRKAKKAE